MASEITITRYRAEDGTLFDTQFAAERHEAEARLGEILGAVAAYGEVSIDQAVCALMEHAVEVKKLLDRV